MKAVILAGGKGSRMGKLSESVPKPMIEVAGKPLLQYQVELCARYGIKEIILIVNHLKKSIIDHFGDGKDSGVHITYYEEAIPLGTVGGIKDIEEQLTEDFLVLYGDVMLDLDLQRLISFHRQKESDATLVIHPNDHPYDSDLLELNDEDRVVKFIPKPHDNGRFYHNMVNAAVYILSPSIFPYLKKGEKADFGRDIFPSLCERIRMHGYNTPEYLKDMGTPERLEQVEADVISGKVKRRNLENKQSAIFLDRDGVLNPDKDLIHELEDMELYPYTSEAIKSINQSDHLAILVTNQSVVARNLISIEGLQEIHKKLESKLGEAGSKLDAIYFCPHHPDKGYPEENPLYKIDCDCRKPKPGMLLEAAKRFNIDLAASYMIGDSERDTLAGQTAGCTTIGVMSGTGHRGAAKLPDYFFRDLKEAVEFISEDPFAEQTNEILERVLNTYKNPLVIAVGGNSRSGKSTFSTYLRKRLEQSEMNTLHIKLDDWIRPDSERVIPHDVFHNFRTEELSKDLEAILAGEVVELNAYTPHPKMEKSNKIYQLQGETVVIVEGVIALAVEEIRKFADINIFMKIEEGLQKSRIEEFYRWKGLNEAEIQSLWVERKAREYDLIRQSVKYADVVI